MLQARSVNNCSRPRLRLLTHLPAVQIPVSSDTWKKPQGPTLFFLLDVFTVGTPVFSAEGATECEVALRLMC